MNKIISKAKIWFIALLVIVVAGAFVFGFMGFNKSVTISDGYELHIVTDVDFPGNSDKIEDAVEKVFEEEGLSYGASYLLYNVDSQHVYVFEDKLSDEVIAKVESAVQTALSAQATISFDVVQYETKAISEQTVWVVGLTSGVALLIVAIYVAIRQKFAPAFTAMAVTCIEALLFLALTALTRVYINSAYYAIVIAGAVLTLLSSVIYTGKAKYELRKYSENADKTTDEIASILECGNLKYNLALAIIAIVFAVAFVAFGPAIIRWTGVAIAIMAVSVAFVNICITPAIWKTFAKIGKNKKDYKASK